jgi:hypothetical protein
MLSAAYCGLISQVPFAEHYSDYFIKITGYYHSADSLCPKAIILSGFHCIINQFFYVIDFKKCK